MPGTVHVAIRHLPKMERKARIKYLFIAMDQASSWIYLEVFTDKKPRTIQQFREQFINQAPFIVSRVLMENDK
jgi:hypothetical protein